MNQMYKYPKTYHLEGSGLSSQGTAKKKIPLKAIASRYLVIEEKMDGANVAISFDDMGKMLLQSRGHFLTGGVREKHFSLFKQWAYSLVNELYLVISDRYIIYGEWLYAKHTIFYNFLPDYFLEYDVLDKESEEFLDTASRRLLLKDLPITSVPVLHSGKLENYSNIFNLIGQSNYIQEGHLDDLKASCESNNIAVEQAIKETETSNLMEGLYVKIEEDGIVKERYKYIREDFITTILNSEGHWLDRVIIPNKKQS